MSRVRTVAAVPLAGVLLTVAAACAAGGTVVSGGGAGRRSAAPDTSVPAATAPAVTGDVSRDCPQRWPTRTTGRLPAGLVVTEVFVCADGTRTEPGRGAYLVRRESRAVAGTGALLAALRRPDEPERNSGVCTLRAVSAPQLLLVGAGGRTLRPAAPLDACHRPQQELLDAYRALRLTAVSEVRTGTLQSGLSAASGCADRSKDVISIDRTARAGGPAAVFPGRPAQALVCVYRVATASREPVGTLEGGRTVSGTELEQLLAGLAAARPASSCGEPHRRYAVLTAGGRSAYTELDGCRRILAGSPPTLRRGGEAYLALLERLARG